MISIIIPSWNTPRQWLSECISSILAQTWTDWEVILVDDASPTPLTRQDLPEGGLDQRFRIIRHKDNSGPGIARNTAVSQARGDYIFTMDSDDVLEPQILEELYITLSADRSLDCAYAMFKTFGAVETIWEMPVKTDRDMIVDQWMPGPGVLMRKSFYNRVGGYCEENIFRNGNEDWDFWMKAAEKGMSVSRVDKPLYRYRISSESLSNSTTKKTHYRTINRMYEMHREFIDGNGMTDRFLYDGYFFSLPRCAAGELRTVIKGCLRHSKSIKDFIRCLAAVLKRIAQKILGISMVTGVVF